jgi:hypothetical protein
MSRIAKLTKSVFDEKTGVLVPDPDNDNLSAMLEMLVIALVSWETERPITVENIALLPAPVITEISNQISAHEGWIKDTIEDTEKN